MVHFTRFENTKAEYGILDDDMNTFQRCSDFIQVPGAKKIEYHNFWQVGQVYDAVLAAGMRPFVEISFMPSALASGKASPRGEILNDLPDRISDVLIFVGVGYSGLCESASGYWAAILALLTAYVGMFGQAVGVQREFSATSLFDI